MAETLMTKTLGYFVDKEIEKNRVTIPTQKVAQIRESVLEIFSGKGITSSTPIKKLRERFRTITSLKDNIRAAVSSAQEQLLY